MRKLQVALGVAAAAAVTAGCGSGSPNQKSIGTHVGQDFVRIDQAFERRPGTVPTLSAFVANFNSWVSGEASGKDIQQDVKTAGFRTDPAPSKPLSSEAREAAAAVVLRYVGRTATKYGPLDGGYLVDFHHGQLAFRCKSRGNPPSDVCKTSHWQQWQYGF